MGRPVVGVVPLEDTERESYWMLPGYLNGLETAGALPLILPLTEEGAALDQLTALCDGFLFPGGQDVDPALYGQAPLPQCGERSPGRDNMERALLPRVLAADKPLFGICRGLQFLNAALGGTLYQDLPSQTGTAVPHRQEPPYDRAAHTVRLEENSPLQALLGTRTLPVNSSHHQGIRDLAPALRPMARAEDGLIEAVYAPEYAFVWAVQWHPERLYVHSEANARLFRAFVGACGGGR